MSLRSNTLYNLETLYFLAIGHRIDHPSPHFLPNYLFFRTQIKLDEQSPEDDNEEAELWFYSAANNWNITTILVLNQILLNVLEFI